MSQTNVQPCSPHGTVPSPCKGTVNFPFNHEISRRKYLISRVCTVLHVNKIFSLRLLSSRVPHPQFAPVARDFHASKLAHSAFYNWKSAFIKPAWYRGFSLCTAKLIFFRSQHLRHFVPFSSPVHPLRSLCFLLFKNPYPCSSR